MLEHIRYPDNIAMVVNVDIHTKVLLKKKRFPRSLLIHQQITTHSSTNYHHLNYVHHDDIIASARHADLNLTISYIVVVMQDNV